MPTPSSGDDDLSASTDEILKKWDEIQKRLKRAELVSLNSVIPAINELRYAGRMLVGALRNPEDNTKVEKALAVADQYLTNADHDISDSLMYYFQDKADKLNFRYGAAAIAQKLPKYSDFLDNLEEGRRLIIESRGNIELRTINYEKARDLIDQLTEEYFILDKAEAFFAMEVDYYKTRIRILRNALIGTVVVLIALILFHVLSG